MGRHVYAWSSVLPTVRVTVSNEIKRDSATPVFRQLAAILRDRIERGVYGPGDRLPSETELEAEYGLARGTIQKTIRALREEGLVVTTRGKGSFVKE
jgi:GntR family transcriptional regulator